MKRTRLFLNVEFLKAGLLKVALIRVVLLNAGFGLALLATTCLLSTCAKEKADDPAVDVNAYMKDLPSWELFSPPYADADIYSDTITVFNCDDATVRSTIPTIMTRTPIEIATQNPVSDVLYLGALIQGKGYRNAGQFDALPIYQRAPLTITLQLLTNDVTRVVEHPDNGSVQTAISELVIAAENDGLTSASSVVFEQRTGYSLEQASLSMGFSARYFGASAKGKFHFENTEEKRTLFASFYQKMFTTTMGIPQKPMDLFSADFTADDLNEQISLGRIGPDNLPLYVASVVWGRMMTLTMTSTYSETQMRAALEASYKCIGGVQLEAQYKTILQESNIQLVSIGGPDSLALNYLRTGNLAEFFKSSPSLTSAEPLFYSLRNVGDNKPATVSETVGFDMNFKAPVQCGYFNDAADFQDALEQRGLAFYEFPTTEFNVFLADESFLFYPDNIPNGGQTALSHQLTYSYAATGLPFEFYLINKAIDNNIWALVFGENEGSFPVNTISIGDIGDLENDDFEVGVAGYDKVYGIGFNVIQNDAENGEYIEVTANAGCPIRRISSGLDMTWTFVGFVSEVPIDRINFEEAASGDDLGVMHFYFGYK